MFTYGSQVNPALLRQDFSPILQAAQAQAQATQQAAAIRAQSMANIGSTIGNAIQTYVQKKEEREKRKGGIDFLSRVFQEQPNLAKTFKLPLDENGKPDQKALGSILDNFKTPEEAIRSFMALNEFAEQNKARQQQEQAASYAAMLSQGGGQIPSSVSNQTLAQFSPQAMLQGRAAYAQGAQAMANLAKTGAETRDLEAQAAARGVPKPVTGYDTFEAANKELNRLREAKAFAPGTIGTVKSEGGRFVIESSVEPPRQIPDAEADARTRLTEKALQADIDTGEAARRLIPNTNRMIGILEGGLDTGKLARAKSNLLAWGKAVGVAIDEDKLADTQQFEAYATQQIMGFIAQTKGAISNKENELFAAMSAGLDRSPETNKRLLAASLERLKLDAAIGDLVRRGNAEGKPFAEIAKERQKLIEAYDAKLPEPESLQVTPVGSTSPANRVGRFEILSTNK
jgi:hypothetical protein